MSGDYDDDDVMDELDDDLDNAALDDECGCDECVAARADDSPGKARLVGSGVDLVLRGEAVIRPPIDEGG